MCKRLLCLGILLATLTSSSGCCVICGLHDKLICCYQSHRWHGCGCGEKYICPWINNPPDCYDPCDDFGNFTGQQWWAPTYGCHRCRQSCDGCGARGGMGGPVSGPMNGMSTYDNMDGVDVQDHAVGGGEELPPPATRQAPAARGTAPTDAPPPSPPARVGRRPRSGPPYNRPQARARQAALQYDEMYEGNAVVRQSSNMSYRRR